jgi:hypothetical protein
VVHGAPARCGGGSGRDGLSKGWALTFCGKSRSQEQRRARPTPSPSAQRRGRASCERSSRASFWSGSWAAWAGFPPEAFVARSCSLARSWLAPERLSFVRAYRRIRESCEARSTCSIRRRVARGPLQAGPRTFVRPTWKGRWSSGGISSGQSGAFPARGRPLTRHRPGAARGRFRWGVQPRGVRASKRRAGLEDKPRRFREAGVPHPPSSGPSRPRLPLLCGPDRRREARPGASLRLRGRSARDRGCTPKPRLVAKAGAAESYASFIRSWYVECPAK